MDRFGLQSYIWLLPCAYQEAIIMSNFTYTDVAPMGSFSRRIWPPTDLSLGLGVLCGYLDCNTIRPK